MENIFKEYLFTKGIFVGNEKSENSFESCLALGKRFGIEIVEGREMADLELVKMAAELLGEYVPASFYRGFPDTVREMSADKLLYDQLLHYTVTYGLGYFDTPGRSIFEADFKRLAFEENTEPKKFVILSEEDAYKRLEEAVADLLTASRPLSQEQYETVSRFIVVYDYKVKRCASKNTAIKLMVDLRDTELAKFIALSDVVKVVDIINYTEYGNRNIKALALKNRDRRFITAILDGILDNGYCDFIECFEKKAVWQGLLHHVHYKAKCKKGEEFLALMRGKGNRSVYSEFEKFMDAGDILSAVDVLKKGKGAGDLLRHLNYIVSRCKTEEEIGAVLSVAEVNNPIILLQLIMQYGNYSAGDARTFKFQRYGMMKIHEETVEECDSRRSVLTEEQVTKLSLVMREKLEKVLRGKLGKVYVAPEMNKIAIPLRDSVSAGGYGTLPTGSRLPLEEGKKIRCFTYWEKVDDIDLSVIGVTDDGEQIEFSWRTMYGRQSDAIVYSGDQTSGYNGGSEYFDVDVSAFKKKYPTVRYLVFSNNVFSYSTFKDCVCRAGYMVRDKRCSGNVFEPKTVKTSFRIDTDSTFAYLFGIDLRANEFVWLNIERDSGIHVAGASSLGFLTDYFNTVNIMSVADLFKMLASEVVSDPAQADVVLSDGEVSVKEGADVIRSCDTEKIKALLG